MCEYIKTKFPHIYLYTSTNGLAFTEEKARRLVHSGIDEVTFSIDGASQDTYVQVPPARQVRHGDRQPARAWPTRAPRTAATCRRSTGATSCSSGTTPTRRWSGRARWPTEFGVDRLCWEITDHPEDSFSRRFAPGTPDFERIRYEIWDNNGLGNAIPGATPRAEIDVRTVLPDLPFMTRAATPVVADRARQEPVEPPVPRAAASYGRRWCASARS